MTRIPDRAVLIVQVFAETSGVILRPALRQYLENMVRDEFADQRRQDIADRQWPDAMQ